MGNRAEVYPSWNPNRNPNWNERSETLLDVCAGDRVKIVEIVETEAKTRLTSRLESRVGIRLSTGTLIRPRTSIRDHT